MSVDFNEMIHADRTKLLAALPKGAKTVCSAGCAGAWYFKWFEDNYGTVDRHVGIELFLEKPADLPANVQWIKNSVADMTDVSSRSIDLLFSGQNLEHLYYSDIQGFFKESNRVLRQGGYLCIDSPNRLVSSELGYIQPQHVLEFSREDVFQLVEAAGFEIVSTHGIWSCVRDDRHYGDVTTVTDDYEWRREQGDKDQGNAFIWWVVAKKVGPPAANFAELVDALLSRRFTPFVASRFRKGLSRVAAIEGTETVLSVSRDQHGVVFYGPYVPLTAGRYVAQFMCKFLQRQGALSFVVTKNNGQAEVGRSFVESFNPGEWVSIDLEFELADYSEGVEVPVLTHGADALVCLGAKIIRR